MDTLTAQPEEHGKEPGYEASLVLSLVLATKAPVDRVCSAFLAHFACAPLSSSPAPERDDDSFLHVH